MDPVISIGRPLDLPVSNHYASNKQAILAPEYRYLWQWGLIQDSFTAPAAEALERIETMRGHYIVAASSVGIPWWVVACLHHMECDAHADGGISNGQPWFEETTIVPKGRGPFRSFVDEAVYSLQQYQTPGEWGQSFKTKNWNDPGWVFWMISSWNGFGSRMGADGPRFTPPNSEPYIYSGFELNGKPLYEKGKHVSDFNFDANAVSTQLGAMAFLKALDDSGNKVFHL